ncbi:MAG: aldolase [Rhodobacteraceae bacterium]|nr:aldolase [Paracoccaceae bacterium]
MIETKVVNLLDCTFRDGGYYNAWDFSPELIETYFDSMVAAGVGIVEIGFRFTKNTEFMGPCAFTTDEFIRELTIPKSLTVAVMLNGSDLLSDEGLEAVLTTLFPNDAKNSPVDLVRIACHAHEFSKVLPACQWLNDRGYLVGFNLMQISNRTQSEVEDLAKEATKWPIEVLYFADSMGSLTPQKTVEIVKWIRNIWSGPIGIHTHDNMGMALQNTLASIEAGVTWVDATVTGMGRGPGNACTELLAIEMEEITGKSTNLVPLMDLVKTVFQPMKDQYRWGSNPFYYLAGKYSIHPTYIQEMLVDTRYDNEDILAVIDHLRDTDGNKYSRKSLDAARNYYRSALDGDWEAVESFAAREVLVLGPGPSAKKYSKAIEAFIDKHKPIVLALNTTTPIAQDYINLRIASHPVRLIADSETHTKQPQPLIVPVSALPETILAGLAGKQLLDFGLMVEPDTYEFHSRRCVAPLPLVLAYALAMVTSGDSKRIFLAGFDGYDGHDPRNEELEILLKQFKASSGVPPVISITPTAYKNVEVQSVFGEIN